MKEMAREFVSTLAFCLALIALIGMLIFTVQYYKVLWTALDPATRAALIDKVLRITGLGAVAGMAGFLSYLVKK